ncbi:DUF192 domain-containing protein [Pseudidiomarina sediminum]|uniref:DUF192 domain-containing protein n=1 Tax=Pseudidiomarina sediminum TaxID=431675 RepID=A0A432YZJ2_9GAMM|nr:DUF192 domain-containing protein [Pseudidiomarina sediminum]
MIKQGRLYLHSRQLCLWPEVTVLTNFPQRFIGLLLRQGLARGQAFWFPNCAAVHSWGMQFAMDVVGLDAQQRIVSIQRNVQPGRLLHLKQTRSIIECEAGLPFPLERWLGESLHFEEKEVVDEVL